MGDDFRTFQDHLLSIYQSAAASVERRKNRVSAPSGRPRMRTLDQSSSGSLVAAATEVAERRKFGPAIAPRLKTFGVENTAKRCAELGLRYLEAKASADQAALAQIESEFKTSTCDPEWATTLTEYYKFFGPGGTRAKIPYVRAAEIGNKIIPLKSEAKIALVADWGTGASPAKRILNEIGAQSPDVFIHLGDVYYSGTPEQYDVNFVRLINASLGDSRGKLPIFALSGNHDMYCGGVGFYDLIKRLNPAP
jgi:hypothetical protein